MVAMVAMIVLLWGMGSPFDDNNDVGAPAVVSSGLDEARTALSGVYLGELTEDVQRRVRMVLAGVLNGKPLDQASAEGGLTEAGFIALAVANEEIMDALATTLRALGVAATIRVNFLAGRAAESGANIAGLRAAMAGLQWVASNTLPEIMSRTAATGERRLARDKAETKARNRTINQDKIITGTEVS